MNDTEAAPMIAPDPAANPLLEPWTGPFEAPPFDRIAPGHFRPAFEAALKEARAEIDAIAADPAPPTFANTIEALERSGRGARPGRQRVLQPRRRRDQRRARGDRARNRPGRSPAIVATPISTTRCSAVSTL